MEIYLIIFLLILIAGVVGYFLGKDRILKYILGVGSILGLVLYFIKNILGNDVSEIKKDIEKREKEIEEVEKERKEKEEKVKSAKEKQKEREEVSDKKGRELEKEIDKLEKEREKTDEILKDIGD